MTRSSLAEVAPGGGTLMIDMLDDKAIVDALIAMATQPTLLARLSDEAIGRPLASWHDYARRDRPFVEVVTELAA